jgi:hypothetical protein
MARPASSGIGKGTSALPEADQTRAADAIAGDKKADDLAAGSA